MAKPKGKRRGASGRKGQLKTRAAKSPTTTRTASARPKNGSRAPPIEPQTKTEACLALLVRPEGASLAELQQLTGWQAHSVRGFLSGTVKKIPGASLTSEKTESERRYFLRRAT